MERSAGPFAGHVSGLATIRPSDLRKANPRHSVAAEARLEARANRSPIGFSESPNQSYFPLQK
jgi:hypothetical protein